MVHASKNKYMGQIRKVGDIYYIEFQARGLMYSQVGGSTEQEARKLLEEIEAKIAGGEALTIVREIDLEMFCEKFLSYAQEKFPAPSRKRFESTMNHWKKFLAGAYPNITKLSQVTPAVIESYKIALIRMVKPKAVNLTILLLREIMEYGIRIGFINDNPTLHISLLKLQATKEPKGARTEAAKEVFRRNLSLEKACAILKIKDVAQVMYWANFIPLKREDVYN
jgi:hypothetical protein